MTRFPDDTGRVELDTCAHCGRVFAPGQVWIVGVQDSGGKRLVVHGGCVEGWNRQQSAGIRQPRTRLKPREPEAYT